MVVQQGDGSTMSGVETFVWRESGSGGSKSNKHRSFWTIRYRKKSGIYDSDPHSLKVPRSHNAWKNELMMTRFANQELPEALWGDNFLELSYGSTDKENPSDSIRISFCALEALRTWALMDMDVEQKEEYTGEEKSNKIESRIKNKESKISTIIPHKSGRRPDRWDYTYTTNYVGSVDCIRHDNTDISYDAKQPDQTTLYSIKVSENTPLETTQGMVSNPIGRFATKPTPVLRPPMCKCVGGRMICAGVAQTLAARKSQTIPNSKFTNRPLLKSMTKKSPQASTQVPKPSPKWMPYCSDTDGPFDMEKLLNSQRSAPLHYTGTIPFWIQNLDPQSYSFLTVTAVVCNDNDSTNNDGFIAVLLRCFVRVNGVRVRLIDTKFVIRRQKSFEKNEENSNGKIPPMVILRERSWKEGSWEEYTVGMKGSRDGNYRFLGTDLEQGRRASKNLPNKFPPIVEKLVVYDDDQIDTHNEYNNCDSNNQISESKRTNTTVTVEAFRTLQEKPTISLLQGKSVSKCAIASGILVSVVDECTLVTLDILSGKILWEYDLMSLSVLSLAVQSERNPTSPHAENTKVVVGDDQGCVHIIQCKGVENEKTERRKPMISKQSYCFEDINEGNRNSNVQKPSSWVEKVVWSSCGRYFAAAAGKKVMINGKVITMGGTVYDFSFLSVRNNVDVDTGKKVKHDSSTERTLMAVALYGGLTIVDAATNAVRHRQFTVGSSAVLSFALSPNGQSIGIGCLDKRLRVFEDVERYIADESNGESNDIDLCDARDWIGMNSGVTCVAFSPDSQRLAALGGSILFIIDQTSQWGEAPTTCCLSQHSEKKVGKASKFNSVAWGTKDILVASTDRFLYMFDLRATIETVPKRVFPFASTPLETDFVISRADGKIFLWGESGIRKMEILHELPNKDCDC